MLAAAANIVITAILAVATNCNCSKQQYKQHRSFEVEFTWFQERVGMKLDWSLLVRELQSMRKKAQMLNLKQTYHIFILSPDSWLKDINFSFLSFSHQ